MIYAYKDDNGWHYPAYMRREFNGVRNFHRLTDEQRLEHNWYPAVEINGDYVPGRQRRTVEYTALQNNMFHIHYRVVDKTLDEVKMEAIDRVRYRRWLSESGGVMLSGSVIRTDEVSQQKVNGLVTGVLADETVQFVDFEAQPGEWITLDRQSIVNIGKGVFSHVQACYAKSKELTEEIQACQNIDDVLGVDINTGWPGV